MSIKKQWENPKVRKFAAILVIIPIAFFGYKSMSSSDNKTSLQDRIAARQAEDRFDGKGKVRGLFDSESIANIDKNEFDEIYDKSVDSIRRKEREVYTEKERVLEMVQQQQQSIDDLTLKLKDYERQLEVRDRAYANTQHNRQSNGGSRSNYNTSYSGAEQGQQAIADAPQQYDERVFDRTPTQLVTAKPQIEGRVIRTITQRSVRSIKSSGVVEEKQQKDLLITQQSLKPEKEVQKKSDPNEGGLIDSDEGVVYLPAGSFFSGVLLTGLDAPTQLAAKSSPMPVVIRVKKEAILPNHFTLDIRECHVIGQAIGDLSSERAHIRAQSITCVRNDGKSVESAIQANAVSDFDGKLGIAGRLVSKNGNLLEGSMAAGFMSGISKAVAPQRTTSINTSGGDRAVWESVDLGSVASAGVFQGSADAMDRLAEYYIALAEQIHPVIEISPGRSITFAVLSGTKLKLGD